MAINKHTGDEGTTSLATEKMILKYDDIVEAY